MTISRKTGRRGKNRMEVKRAFRRSAIALAVAAASSPMAADLQTMQPRIPSLAQQPPRPTSQAIGEIRIDTANVQAFGKDAQQADVLISLYDIQGKPLRGATMITLSAAGTVTRNGQAITDADPKSDGMQILVDDGKARLHWQGKSSDVLQIQAGFSQAGLKLSQAEERSISVAGVPGLTSDKGLRASDADDMLIVGVIEGAIRLDKHASGSLQPARIEDGFERELRHLGGTFSDGKGEWGGRSAFYLKGKIKGDVLLTAAYDSDKESGVRMFRDIRPDEFYPVYGDDSTRLFDARSAGKLYVRIDKGRSYALYGDFATGDGFSQLTGGGHVASVQARNLGQYNRSLVGARAHLEEGPVSGNVFGAYDNLRQVIDEFPAVGTSGPYKVRNSSGIRNSEKVELITRDRNQPGVILAIRPQQRLFDYTFEPFSGDILFTAPVKSFDEYGNPVSIRVTYEVEQGGERYWVAGVDGQVRVADNLIVGGSYATDRNPLTPYQLGSAHVVAGISNNTIVVAEVARSESKKADPTAQIVTTPGGSPVLNGTARDLSGNAARIEVVHKTDTVEARAWAGKSQDSFDNDAASYSKGKAEAGLHAAVQTSATVSVYLDAKRSDDAAIVDTAITPVRATRNAAAIGVSAKASPELTIDGAITRTNDNGITPTANIPLAAGTTLGTGIGNADLSSASNAALCTSCAPMSSTALRLRMTYIPIGTPFKLNAEVQQDIHVKDNHRAAAGATYAVNDKTSVYGRVEWQNQAFASSQYGAGRLLQAGVESRPWEQGQVFSEYRLRDAASGRDVQYASGLRQGVDIGKGLRLVGGTEYQKSLTGAQASALALHAGVDYTPNPLWKIAARQEWRIAVDDANAAQGSRSMLSAVSAARKMSANWTILARNYFLSTKYDVPAAASVPGDSMQDRLQVGLAYRDTETNRVNALARYEHKINNQGLGASIETRDAINIVSLHADYHPGAPLWLTGRVAAQWVENRFPDNTGAQTSSKWSAFLLGGRFTYDVSERTDIGLLASTMIGRRSDNGRQWALGMEAGYRVIKNTWLSAGYNIRGFSAGDLTSDYTNRGIYLRLRLKFDEGWFGL